MSEDLARLAAHAGQEHVVVVGGGIAGLVAALECAKVGMRVSVLEAADAPGGVVRSAEVGGVVVDIGADSYATRGGGVRALIDEVGLGEAVVAPEPAGAWIAGIPEVQAAPLPRGSVLGIPANPWTPEVRRIIGWAGAWRAYVDRVRPPLTIGHEHSLGALVRSRMGQRVLDRLVAPVTTGVYSARPDDIDVDLAAPGLNAALTRTGSLSGAVDVLNGDREGAPGSAVEGIEGGMARLVMALVARLEELGANVSTGARVVGLRPAGEGWSVSVDAVVAAAAPERPDVSGTPEQPDAPGQPAHPEHLEQSDIAADAVIVAVPEAAARALLAPVVPGLDARAEAAPVVEIVTLVLRAPALDARPRGSGVLTVPGSHVAKALTHSTAKWGWLARAVEPGVHVVRVSFGAQDEEPATAGLDDADAAALAIGEASALLGIALDPSQVLGSRRDRHVQAQPGAAMGRVARAAAARDAVHAAPRLGVVGAWLSGTGLAQVVPDARREADRVRAALLWAGHDEE